MKGIVVGAVALALAGVGVGTAIGQGQGGTLGPGAVGAKSFEVRIKEKDFGVNCGLDNANRCFRRGPRPANVIAGSGAVYDGSTKVGTAVFYNVTGKKLQKQNSLDVFSATISFANRQDSITVMGPSSDQGAPCPTPSWAARASMRARGAPCPRARTEVGKEIRIPLNFTFIP